MTPGRRYEEPPRWPDYQISLDCERALEAMVRRRLAEGGRPYGETFARRRKILERLFVQTSDLSDLRTVAGRKEYAAALRYLAGPPVSADDLRTLGRAERFRALSEAERPLSILRPLLDPLRFSWVAEDRAPGPGERDRALVWTAGLWAVEETRTRRRTRESREQEREVERTLEAVGFRRVKTRRVVERPDEIEPGTYTREVVLRTAKCDRPARLAEGRLLAIECKVSNSELNSVKRLRREVCGKARLWREAFGRLVIPAAVLRGVYKPADVIGAQSEDGIAVFWEHDLEAVRLFVVGGR